MDKKFAAGFQMLTMVVSLFALCHFLDLGEDVIPLVSAADPKNKTFDDWVTYFNGGELIENETWVNYPISSVAEGAGCCFISRDGQICGTAVPENCVSDSPFAEGALCSETSFCEKGCCYSESTGVYDKNVLEFECPTSWTRDANCNMPGANLGCCVLGENTIFETRGQCEVDSLVRAIGGSESVDWRENVGEGECLLLSVEQKEGACVLGEGACKFVSELDCLSYNGDFAEGYLCTSPSLNTSCEMTGQTKCVDGKDEVYFVDSCGNPGNVYDSTRTVDPTYWDLVFSGEDVCGYNEDNGNANSESCGNCDRFAGGICGSSGDSLVDVDVGGFYCKDTSCMFDGVSYENGESWCVYDGAIGGGQDVVGSRHWKYVCSQGVVVVEPCADYRNQICIQENDFVVDGGNVEFSNAACVANNWRECIDINGEEDAMTLCEEALNCRVDTVDVANKFKFDVCLPDYPGGFSFTDERYVRSAETLCSMGSQTCTAVKKPKTWGGCKWVANKNCLSETFAQEMNDFCTGLGDCGGSVNIVGEYSENYVVKRDGSLRRSMFLSDAWIEKLKELAEPISGQFAEVEDYSDYLKAAGVWGEPGALEFGVEEGGSGELINSVGAGIGGIGMALGTKAVGGYVAGMLSTSAASVAAYGGVAIAASIGMVAGSMLAKSMGLSEGGSMLMAAGGALVAVGVFLLYSKVLASLSFLGPWGIAIGIVLIVVASFFGGSDCDPIEIAFECRAWQPPIGGDDCNECNGDPLKPCSKYRCESLGTGCELINIGSDDELCVNGNPNDVTPPVIQRQPAITFAEGNYIDNADGFEVVGLSGGCLEAYTPLAIGIVASEPSQCRFDIEPKDDFDDMTIPFGSNSYLYNHTVVFPLPDPSHGQSQGVNWTGELELFVRCRDRSGIVSPGFLKINACVVEGDDKSPPRIVDTEPKNGRLVGFENVVQDVKIVTNEFATCRWDIIDKEYFAMRNSFDCNDTFASPSNPRGYECSGSLPLGSSADMTMASSNSSGNYFVRCMDQPWLEDESERNANSESFVFGLKKPGAKISIDKIAPTSDFEVSTDFTTIDLKIATSGGGKSHFCSYSFSGYDRMIEMFETGNARTHTQVLNRGAGVQNIYVECRDETGDFARNSTSFNIIRDTSEPAVARVWQTGGFVNLVLNEEGECKFSFDNCRFAWSEGHELGTGKEIRFAVVRGEKYYIKCRDDFENAPNKCSVEVVAT